MSKSVYDHKKERIREECKLRKEWIQKYSEEKLLDKQKLNEWKHTAMDKLDKSDVGPASRKAIKQYLSEQQELSDALDKAEAREEKEDTEAKAALVKRNAVGACWN